jgi:phosphate transport system permease protein
MSETQQAPGAPDKPSAQLTGEDARARRRADAIFEWLSTGAGIAVVSSIGLIGLFLLIQSLPSLLANEANFLLEWEFIASAEQLYFGIRDLLIVTVMTSAVALALAMPVALGIALFLTHYAPLFLRRPMAYVVDTLAAVPSIVYGLWGVFVLGPVLTPVALWLNDKLGWIPLFSDGNVSITGGGTIFTAGIVLAIMILPIITSVTREVFRQTPDAHIEGALALGATKWEMIRTTVLPFGRSGYIAASMLGLGRALGETVAVLIVLRVAASPSQFSLFDGGYTFASKIASAAAEFSLPLPTGAYIAAGLVLFALTFVVNAVARWIAGGKVHRQ